MDSPPSNVHINASLTRELFLQHRERMFLLGSHQEERHLAEKNNDCIFLDIKDGSEELIIGTPSGMQM